MPSPGIQNLQTRAQQVGKSIQDFSDDLTSAIKEPFGTSENISLDPLGDALAVGKEAVASAASDLTKALGEPVDLAAGELTSALNSLEIPSAKKKGITLASLPRKNILSKYSSYNCVFTFGALSTDEVNFPDATYRKTGMPSSIVLQTGGTIDKQVKTLPEKLAKTTGEYFIDNVSVDTIVAPNPKTKQTNATGIEFTVREPFSMGIFLQTVMLAALKGGHKNYIDAPFLLTVEFIGWDDNGHPIKVNKARRMFPLKLTNVTFDVTESGSEYTVSAIPWHELAFTDETQKSQVDIDIKGSTIIELLQTGPESLATILNNRELEQVKAGNKKVGNQYVILFPNGRSLQNDSITGGKESEAKGATTQSVVDDVTQTRDLSQDKKDELLEALTGMENGNVPADFDAELSKILGITVRRSKLGESIREYAEKEENTNKIGSSKIVKSYLDSGKPYFGKPAFTKDKDNPNQFHRGNITISDEGRRITFKKGAKIQDIIEEVILLSDYGRQFISETPDSTGFKKWFRIDANVYNISDSKNIDQVGKSAKVFVYKITPYKVHTSRLASPTQATPGIKKLKKEAMREYNYIYTGKNDDILNFDIQINSAFFSSITGDYGGLGKDTKVQGSDSKVAQPDAAPKGQADGKGDVLGQALSPVELVTGSNTGDLGSGPQVHPETAIARSFNDAIVNSPVDLIQANMKIWGDPYYIADSGMGNYDANEASSNMTSDGTMDYQNGEVDVLINFRTPIDIGFDGQMKFPSGGTKPVGQFSGLYQVLMVKNEFSANQFTQELQTIRRRNQEVPEPADVGLETVVEKGPDAVISPVASTPATKLAEAEAELTAALSKAGGQVSQGIQQGLDDLNAAINELPDIPAKAADALNQAKNKLTSAASSAGDQLTAALKGKF